MWSWFEGEIAAMSLSDYQVMFLVFTLAVPVLIYFSYKAFKRFRFIDATATSLVRSAAQGHVELKGLGEWLPNDTILSPFSQSRCVWYHCSIDKRKKSGKNTTWSNIFDEVSDGLFRLVDQTGHCIVNPDRAHVVPEQDITWYGSDRSHQNRAPKSSSWITFGSGNYRFRERLIRTASPVYALGWFSSFHTDVADDYIEKQTEETVRQWKIQPERYLRQFDLNKNNKLDKDEWKVVRNAARKQVLDRVNQENQAQHLMSKPENSNLPFILSAVPEESLVRRKKWRACGFVVLAFAIFVALLLMYSIRSPLPA